MPDKLAVLQTEESIKELERFNTKLNETIEQFNKLVPLVDKTNSLLTKGTPKEYLEGLKEQKEAQKQITEAERRAIESRQRLVALNRKLARAEEQRNVKVESLKLQIQEANKANKQQAKEILGLITPYQKFVQQVNEAKNRAKNLHAEMLQLEQDFKNGIMPANQYKKELNRLSNEYAEAKIKASGLDVQLKNIDKSVGDHQRNVGNYSSAIRGLGGSLSSLAGAFGVGLGISAFAQVLQSSYGTIKELNSQNYALKEVFETEAQVAHQKEYLSEITNKYGLELVSTTEAYTKFSAAIKNTNIEGEEGRKIFTAFSAASSKLGLSADEQAGIFKALEQMMSKGKIQAEELRGQLGDRMSGAFRLFADAMGVSTAELDSMLKKGKVFSAEVLPKVAEQLEKQYDLSKNTDTLAGAQNRLSNAWTSFLDRIASDKDIINGVAGVFERLNEVLNMFLDAIVSSEIEESQGLLESYAEIVTVVLYAIEGLAEIFLDFTGQSKDLNFEISDLSKLFKGAFYISLSMVKSVLEVIKTVVYGVVDAFKDLGGILRGLFSGDWDNTFVNLEKRMKSFADNMQKISKDAQHQANKLVASTPEEKAKVEKEERGRKYHSALTKATKEKQEYFSFEGKYYSTKTGKNTLKSVDDYIDKNGKLEKKEKTKDTFATDDKPKKPKKPKASQISAEKRDAIDNITAERDRSLAELKVQKVKGEITEIAYQEARIKVIQDYATKIQNLLNENNAKENKLSAQAQKKAADELEKSLKDIFDVRKKAVETQQTELIATNEKERNEILNNEDLSETERVTKLIENNQKKRDLISKNYEELLALAKEFNQADFDITKDYHNQSEKAEEEHLKLLKELNSAMLKDIEIQTQREEAFVNMTYEQKKAAILQDKSLKLADKELQIKLLEYEQQKKINEEKIKGLKATIEELKLRQSENGSLTQDEEILYFNTNAEISRLESENVNLDQNAIEDQAKFLVDKFAGVRDIIANGFKNLGLDGVSDQFKVMFDNTLNLANGFYKSLGDKQKAMREIAAAGAQIALSFGSKMIEEEKNRRIAQIDEEIKHSQEQTDMEISFINQRLEAYSNMSDLTQEQMEDRNALEDEARVLKEQQEQREKMLQAQKLRAEQKAQAQQTLIDGASGAVKAIATYGPTPVGWGAAAASVAFSALQYALIMSKNPVPQYFKGRKGGKKEIAWTQERGAEIITDKHGNIKTLGTNKGATLTQLEQGDTVYTAEQSKNILKNIPQPPIAGDDIFRKSALKNIVPIVHHSDPIDYDKLALKIGEQQEKIARKYDKTTTYEENGYIYKQEGARIPVIIGRAKAQNIIIKSRSNERN